MLGPDFLDFCITVQMYSRVYIIIAFRDYRVLYEFHTFAKHVR